MHRLLLETATFTDFLTELAVAAAGATSRHCGITVRGETGPYTVTSSDPAVDQLDELQYSAGQGPCLAAPRTGDAVFAEDMAAETRWVLYLSQAAGALELAIRASRQAGRIENPQTVISSRSVIDQAVGVLMMRRHIDAETAFGLLRQTSPDRNIKVRKVAVQNSASGFSGLLVTPRSTGAGTAAGTPVGFGAPPQAVYQRLYR